MMLEPLERVTPPPMLFEGIHCTIGVNRPARGIVLITLDGHDIGELGDGPFRAMEKDFIADGPLQLFIDARLGKTASIEVSGEWARWLAKHRGRFSIIRMLTASRFIQMSANLVRRFADLGETMQLYSEPRAFDAVLAAAIAKSCAPRVFEGAHCVITISRPVDGVLLVRFEGHDIGEHGEEPFSELERNFGDKSGSMDLFIDARKGLGASVHVSGAWANWLNANRTRFRQINMLTGSRFIEISASFVRKFSALEELMDLYSDAGAFEEALERAVTTRK